MAHAKLSLGQEQACRLRKRKASRVRAQSVRGRGKEIRSERRLCGLHLKLPHCVWLKNRSRHDSTSQGAEPQQSRNHSIVVMIEGQALTGTWLGWGHWGSSLEPATEFSNSTGDIHPGSLPTPDNLRKACPPLPQGTCTPGGAAQARREHMGNL
ncbi:uncharacterized protein LOC122233029 isoform X2 [Panthera tigris]|uniref:uncharacterized protein LOC122233029 isoform X2 n=1 Tax=Panthera tigris TaxID=9694 RepID=UPI001C6FBE9D|nr:uncharacterized protein LOC122233029 isoform X2 [Panthera tigris]